MVQFTNILPCYLCELCMEARATSSVGLYQFMFARFYIRAWVWLLTSSLRAGSSNNDCVYWMSRLPPPSLSYLSWVNIPAEMSHFWNQPPFLHWEVCRSCSCPAMRGATSRHAPRPPLLSACMTASSLSRDILISSPSTLTRQEPRECWWLLS